jgi:hypothetical protein
LFWILTQAELIAKQMNASEPLYSAQVLAAQHSLQSARQRLALASQRLEQQVTHVRALEAANAKQRARLSQQLTSLNSQSVSHVHQLETELLAAEHAAASAADFAERLCRLRAQGTAEQKHAACAVGAKGAASSSSSGSGNNYGPVTVEQFELALEQSIEQAAQRAQAVKERVEMTESRVRELREAQTQLKNAVKAFNSR